MTTFLHRLNDPKTRTGTAWWGALGACLVDTALHGMTWPVALLLASMAGLGIAATMAKQADCVVP